MFKKAGLLFLITFVVYLLSFRGEGIHWNYFVILADAFLHGRLNVLVHPSYLNELVNFKSLFYVVFPPMPAFLLIPFVAIFGKEFPQPLFSIFLGAVNVAVAFLVTLKIFRNTNLSVWISFLYGFGTIQWYHAEVGSAWYVAHIVAMFFLWLLIWESVTKRRIFIIGLLIGSAYLARIPTILSVIFILIYLQEKFFILEKGKIRIFPESILMLILGILPAFILNALYNFARYGVFFDIGYTLLPIFNEPWYRYGFVSIKYIPIHLKEIFTAMPKIDNKPPFVIPNLFAMAVWLITPAYFLSLFVNLKKRICFAALVAAVSIFIPELMHGGNGFTQFGYRHTMDFLPFALILIAHGLKHHFKIWAKLLIVISILVNLWGVIMISFLNIWVM